jgi:hypothetical protein
MAQPAEQWIAIRKSAEKWDVDTATGFYVAMNLREDHARLIAAAPDMYTSLKAMTDWVRAALRCKTWNWDEDQRDAAERDLAAALAAPHEGRGSIMTRFLHHHPILFTLSLAIAPLLGLICLGPEVM